MIASIATAVLPVWRSPMISSRWPRPIGTIESIAFRPVCIGWSTDWRAITPGATFSITSVILALIGPLPSIGWPRAFTTRPISSGPTGTSRMRPVHLTVSPSEMCSYSPRITAPTESRSRFSARPNDGVPSAVGGNSSISPCIASDRPCTRTMPSVTDTTVPSLRMFALTPRPSMRLLISSEISAGLSCMTLSFFLCKGLAASGGCQRNFHLFKARFDGGVEHFVTDHHTNAADQRRVLLDRELQLAAETLFERGGDVAQGGAVDREGAVHHGIRRAALRAGQHAELPGDLGQRGEAAVLEQRHQEVVRVRRQRRGVRAGDNTEHLLGRGLGVVRELEQLGIGGDGGDLVEPGAGSGE